MNLGLCFMSSTPSQVDKFLDLDNLNNKDN